MNQFEKSQSSKILSMYNNAGTILEKSQKNDKEGDDSVEKKMIGKDLKKFEHLKNNEPKNPDKEDSDKVVKKSDDIETLTPHSESSETEGFQELEDEKVIDDFDADNKEKSQSDELEKGGAGSRGGKIIGHTKSGKPIYDSQSHDSHKNYSAQDHLDASDTHMNAFANRTSKMDATEADEASAHHYREYKRKLKEKEEEVKNLKKSFESTDLTDFQKSQSLKILSMYK